MLLGGYYGPHYQRYSAKLLVITRAGELHGILAANLPNPEGFV